MFENFRIVRLSDDTFVSDFDCGNYDLNDFLKNDALKTAVLFYQKNGFLPLDKQQFQQDVDTSLLYYDLSQLV